MGRGVRVLSPVIAEYRIRDSHWYQRYRDEPTPACHSERSEESIRMFGRDYHSGFFAALRMTRNERWAQRDRGLPAGRILGEGLFNRRPAPHYGDTERSAFSSSFFIGQRTCLNNLRTSGFPGIAQHVPKEDSSNENWNSPEYCQKSNTIPSNVVGRLLRFSEKQHRTKNQIAPKHRVEPDDNNKRDPSYLLHFAYPCYSAALESRAGVKSMAAFHAARCSRARVEILGAAWGGCDTPRPKPH